VSRKGKQRNIEISNESIRGHILLPATVYDAVRFEAISALCRSRGTIKL
jgi:hypothetical protein